jgi:hypothetical protein
VAAARAADTVVVLRNGNVIEGDVSRVGDRFVIRRQGSEIRLPEADVWLTAADLRRAYRQIAGQVNRQAGGHARLAHWCWRHELRDEAAEQLTLARRANPDYPGLTELERHIASADNGRQVRLPAAAPQPDIPALDGVRDRLSKRTMLDFTVSVQPLVLNRCANATCHGPATKTAYQLARPPRTAPMTRSLTEKNLSATLGMIDIHEPTNSLLLLSARAPHGGAPCRLDESQRELLTGWVMRAAAEIDGRRAPSPDTVVRDTDAIPPLHAPEPGDEPATGHRERGGAAGNDPFDPDIFNRLHGGT